MSKLQELLDEALSLTEQINKLKSDQADVHQSIAEATCPFKVGDRLRGKKGLASTGVEVSEVHAPKFPSSSNKWAITCFALSKAGTVTQRVVGFDEWGMSFDKLEKM